MSAQKTFEFNEATIRKIFGSLDGEGENINRLKEYYFKTDTFDQVISDLPVRILVGNKGIGKSALFRIAMTEQRENGDLPILIKPDDVAEIGEKKESLIISIRKWKFGLTEIIAKKVLSEFGLVDDSLSSRIIKVGGKLMTLLTETIIPMRDKVNLAPSQAALIDKFLNSTKIIVYLDDLDRGWQNREEGLVMISALINSIRDMSSENPGLSFKLALRSDVYWAVRREDESSDKIDGLVVWHSYQIHEIFVMLVKRFLTFTNKHVDESILQQDTQYNLSKYLDPIMERTFAGKGKWSNVPTFRVILSLIRNRPRDLVKLCTMAARNAHKRESAIICTRDFESILPEYSKSIISDTVAEYKSELPQVERLLYGFKPFKQAKTASDIFIFSTSELHAQIFRISELGKFTHASGKVMDEHDLTEFLYKINFITARKEKPDGFIDRKNFEHDSYLASSFRNFGYDWEIHLAYRWVLQADSLEDIFKRISI
jgi:hypothetical protein